MKRFCQLFLVFRSTERSRTFDVDDGFGDDLTLRQFVFASVLQIQILDQQLLDASFVDHLREEKEEEEKREKEKEK